MHIRQGHKLSKRRQVKGGSPQGTKLGNFLFCVTLENIENVRANPDSIDYENVLISPPSSPVHDQDCAIPAEYQRAAMSTPCTSEEIN